MRRTRGSRSAGRRRRRPQPPRVVPRSIYAAPVPRDETGLSRRALLVAGAGGATGVAGGGGVGGRDVVPGRGQLFSAVGLNRDGAPVPDGEAGRPGAGGVPSDARGGGPGG